MAKVTDPSFQFWFDEKWYTVQGAETMARLGTKDDMSTMRAEYTRMRDVAQKRIKRLEKQFPESKAYQSHRHGFPKLKELDKRDFAKAFSELAKFVRAKGSTVTGQKQIKQKTINTWNQQGLSLNNQNYDKAIKILETMRKNKITYGSDKVVQLADTMQWLSDNDTNQWLNNLEKLLPHAEELKDIPEVQGYSFDEVLRMIGE